MVNQFMNLCLHQSFLRNLVNLTDAEQKQTVKVIELLMQNAETPGIRSHTIVGYKGTKYTSYSPNMDIRLLVVNTNNKQVVVYVDHHDAAYKWAETHGASFSETGTYFELVGTPITENANEAPNIEDNPEPVWGKSLEQKLTSLGYPAMIAELVSTCSSPDDLLDVIDTLSPELQEALLSSATGKRIFFKDISAFCSSRVIMIQSDEQLLQALSYPLDEWRIYLHNKQTATVETYSKQNIVLLGGPGTGKSTVLLHRSVRLAQLGNAPVILMTNSKELVSWLTNNMVKLVNPVPNNLSIVLTEDLRSIMENKNSCDMYLLIDEAQDLDSEQLWWLIDAPNKRIFSSLAIDTNQLLTNKPKFFAISKLIQNAKAFFLSYSYRLSRENGVVINNLGKHLERITRDRKKKGLKGIAPSSYGYKIIQKSTVPINYGFSSPKPEVVFVVNGAEMSTVIKEYLSKLSYFFGEENIAIISLSREALKSLKTSDLEIDRIQCFLASEVRGLEFFGGLIIGLEDFQSHILDDKYITNFYIALSRFREKVILVASGNREAERQLQNWCNGQF